MSTRVLIVLSDNGGDPTEIAVPWSILVSKGIQVEFATETGVEAHCDPRMIKGPLAAILGATGSARALYHRLTATPEWKKPHSWTDPAFSFDAYDGVLLPGGHDKPMRQYLESASLRSHLVKYFPLTKRDGPGPRRKVVAAICHGVLALARVKDAEGHSVLWDVQTTTLPVHMEKAAYYSTAAVLGDYYRTYPEYTADEVRLVVQGLLSSPSKYSSGGVLNAKPFVVIDPAHFYVSARFPGDAEKFGNTFVRLLEEAKGAPAS
ncbi:hypothetical protein PLICRDRAFT_99075 [Plicaturopsis crispa FD-325 SS-3]|nr:hypothetical protein PLICRDRAFT_99075 [Plicaturopsis crispa FD-325 SS-3]